VTVRRNIIANFSGSAWSAVIGLAFVPVYIKLMGVESYGIVGIFASLTGMLAILDLGLSQAMNREMARLSTDQNNAGRMADTARTLEIVYWVIALAVVAVIVAISSYIAYSWLNPVHLSREFLLQTLWIIALVIGLRWPVAIYTGGLNGLQRQVLVNTLLAIFATIQAGGALLVLWFIDPTVQAFFLWQVPVAFLQVIVLRVALWYCLPGGSKGKFRKDILADIWRFAAGMTGVSALAMILLQMDKLLLSKLLSLSDFGYYMFAASAAGVLHRIFAPVFTAYYPRLTELVAKGDHAALIETYHQACQFMAVAILPLALCMTIFSRDILEIWTRNHQLVVQTSTLMALLVIGNALGGLMNIPYALQLANGWTRLAFYINMVAVIVLAPAIYFATKRWGMAGAASIWIVLNAGYVIFSIQFMHRRLLVGEKWHWYIDDVGKPLLAALFVVGVGTLLMTGGLQDYEKVIRLAVIFCAATIAVIGGSKLLVRLILVRYQRVEIIP